MYLIEWVLVYFDLLQHELSSLGKRGSPLRDETKQVLRRIALLERKYASEAFDPLNNTRVLGGSNLTNLINAFRSFVIELVSRKPKPKPFTKLISVISTEFQQVVNDVTFVEEGEIPSTIPCVGLSATMLILMQVVEHLLYDVCEYYVNVEVEQYEVADVNLVPQLLLDFGTDVLGHKNHVNHDGNESEQDDMNKDY